jgi:imidazolonepropionase-like amidohydrolase
VAEAEAHGTYVMAHAYSAGAIARGVRCGVRTFEHGNLIDAETARLVADAGGFVVPNLVAYDALERHGRGHGLGDFQLQKLQVVLEAAQGAFGTLRAAGVRVGFGTDLQGPIWPYQSEEFRLRSVVDAPMDVVRSATSVNADLIRRGDLGRVSVGATADLIVVDGNPLEDAAVLAAPERTVRLVITEGRVRRGRLD